MQDAGVVRKELKSLLHQQQRFVSLRPSITCEKSVKKASSIWTRKCISMWMDFSLRKCNVKPDCFVSNSFKEKFERRKNIRSGEMLVAELNDC